MAGGAVAAVAGTPATTNASGGTGAGSDLSAYTAQSIQLASGTIPLLFGLTRVVGWGIWSTAPAQTVQASGVVKNQVSFAVAFGRPEPSTVAVTLRRLWANGKLIYDATTPGGVAMPAGLTIRFYPGSETQTVDPAIAADRGNYAPAFRGMIYCVLDGFDRNITSGILPNIVGEIDQHSENRAPIIPFTDSIKDYAAVAMDFKRGLMLCFDHGSTTQQLDVYDTVRNTLRYSLTLAEPSGSYVGFSLAFNGDPYFWSFKAGVSNSEPIRLYSYETGEKLCEVGNESGSVTENSTNNTLPNTFGTMDGFAQYSDFCIVTTIFGAAHVYARVGTQFTHRMLNTGYGFNAGKYATGARIKGNNIATNKDWYSQNYQAPVPPPPSIPKNFSVGYFSTGRDVVRVVCTNTQGSVPVVTALGRTQVGVYPGGPIYNYYYATGSLPEGFRTMITLAANEYASAIFCGPEDNPYVTLIVRNDTLGKAYVRRYDTVWTKQLTIDSNVISDVNAFDLVFDKELADTFGNAQYDRSMWQNVPTNGGSQIALHSDNGNLMVIDLYSGESHDVSVADFDFALADGTNDHPTMEFRENDIYDVSAGTVYYSNRAGETRTPNAPGKALLFNTTVTEGYSLAQYLTSLCEWGGYAGSDVETDFDEIDIIGAVVNVTVGLVDLLSQICALYRIDISNPTGKIRFSRQARDADLTFAHDFLAGDLAPITQQSEDKTRMDMSRDATFQLPGILTVDYLDVDNNNAIGTQSYKRTQFPVRTSNSDITLALSVNIIMHASDALYWLSRAIFDMWNGANVIVCRLPQGYLDLEPGDYIRITEEDGTIITAKVEETTLNGDFSLSLSIRPFAQFITFPTPNPVDAGSTGGGSLGSDSPTGDPSNPTSPVVSQRAPIFKIIDNLQIVSGADTFETVGPNSLVKMPYQWVSSRQGAIYLAQQLTNGQFTEWAFNASGQSTVGIGYAATKLAAPANKWAYDLVNTVEVAFEDASALVSCTETDWLAGVNQILIGDEGRWELIFFMTATYNSARQSYTLSSLLRGRRGTDLHVGDHKVNDTVILGSPFLNNFAHMNVVEGQLPFNSNVQFVPVSAALNDSANPQEYYSFDGSPLKPLTVQNIFAAKSGSDVVLTWNRRSRLDTDLHDSNGTVSLDEGSESYSIDIYLGTDIVRTVTATSETYTYLAADQATDGQPSPMLSIHVTVYQVSEAVGRGWPSDVTIEVS